jgi:hypothetical protein
MNPVRLALLSCRAAITKIDGLREHESKLDPRERQDPSRRRGDKGNSKHRAVVPLLTCGQSGKGRRSHVSKEARNDLLRRGDEREHLVRIAFELRRADPADRGEVRPVVRL